MDTAVALVKAYLEVNGYFCVTEYPLLETYGNGTVRTISDLDILAFRFPQAGREVRLGKRRKLVGDVQFKPDPALGSPNDGADMIVGEVKRGRARFNPPARKPEVLAAALMRFGCCHTDHAREMAGELLHTGHARNEHGHAIRMIAFGGSESGAQHNWHTVSLDSVVRCLQQHLNENWETLRHVQFSNETLDLLAILKRVDSSAEIQQKNGAGD